jgi:hypothetical protein
LTGRTGPQYSGRSRVESVPGSVSFGNALDFFLISRATATSFSHLEIVTRTEVLHVGLEPKGQRDLPEGG